MKPDFITDLDFNILKKMYPNDIDKVIEKLNNHYPVQYLIGNVNFYGYKIEVDERVLIPRFETEGLVEETIKQIKLHNINPKIIEIGTGSGCIAIALSKELNCQVTAIDNSRQALQVAIKNAEINNANIIYELKDIKNCDINSQYNVLISNPPYVSYEEPTGLETKYEPQNAIFAADEGLEFYKIIIAKSLEFLSSKSLLAFEIGCNQGKILKIIAQTHYPNAKIIIKKDLQNRDRYLFIIND